MDDKDRTELSKALGEGIAWSSKIMSCCGMMALPAIGGMWLDDKWGISPALTAVGMVFGLVAGVYCLIQMTKTKEKEDGN